MHETAIEKWEGLTRRIIAIERGYHYDDPSLIRHVYDLNAIESAEPIPENFLMLDEKSRRGQLKGLRKKPFSFE